MPKKVVGVCVAVLVVAGFLGLALLLTVDREEIKARREIKRVLAANALLELEAGKLPAGKESVAALSKEEKDALYDAYAAEIRTYYAENAEEREALPARYRQYLDNGGHGPVEAGIFDFEVIYLEIDKENGAAKVECRLTGWSKWVFPMRGSGYSVSAAVQEDRSLVNLVWEEDSWKIRKVLGENTKLTESENLDNLPSYEAALKTAQEMKLKKPAD